MIKLIFLVVAMMLSSIVYSQTPFTTLLKEPRVLRKIVRPSGKVFYKAVDSTERITQFEQHIGDANYIKNNRLQDYVLSEKEEINFFKNNNLAFNIVNKGGNRLSLNSEIIHYKLYIANPNETNPYRINRYNIPLLLISKLSTNSDAITTANAYDVLDYNGAPITLRIMPSFRVKFDTYNDIFYLGLYSDLRGINYSQNTNLDFDFVWTNGAGFTYQGDSEGAKLNENADYIQGKYSISLMYQVASGNDKILNSLFDTNKGYASAIQGIFVIKLNKDSPLSLRVGYQYFLTPLINGSRSNFSIALGI